MDSIYNVAIVGYGGMGGWHHRLISEVPRIQVSAVCDIDESRCVLAREKGVPKATCSLEEILQDEAIDAIVCATPNNFHRDITIRALEAGKNVICEKPAAMTSEELADMISAAERTGKLFTIHQNRRADRDYLLMRETVESGRLGDVFTIESRVLGSRGIPQGWRQYTVAGGGMMLDWGVHLIDQIVDMYKPQRVKSVYCNMYNVVYDECDDGFYLIMKLSGGVTARIEVGTSHFVTAPRWYVCGSRGGLVINDWDCGGRIICEKAHEVTFEEEIVQTKAGPTKTMAPRHKSTVEEELLNPDDYGSSEYTRYYENFALALDGRAEPIVKPEEAMRVMKIMECAKRSHESGEAVLCDI